jgi:hypothetical protein
MLAKSVFITLSVILIVCCSKDDFDMHDPDVDQFVKIVKNGNYINELGYELPDFKMEDISRLLYYTHDTSQIEQFPHSPYSSAITTPKYLNECLLWTIDGIRFQDKYPSLEPCLIDTSNLIENFGYSRLSGKQLNEVADSYAIWYDEYKLNSSEEIRKKNILEKTNYMWR